MSTKKKEKVKSLLQDGFLELREAQNAKLDQIEKFVRGELTKINERNKAVNGFVVGEVKYLMDNKLYNMDLTIAAIKDLLTEANIIGDIETKITEKRKAIHEKQEKAAQEKMKENMAAKANEAAKVEEAPPVQDQLPAESPAESAASTGEQASEPHSVQG